VLIDPVFAGQDQGETADEMKRDAASIQQFQWQMKRCADLARESALTPSTPHDCFRIPSGLSEVQTEYLINQTTRPARYEAILSESKNLHAFGCLSEDEQEEERAARPFGDKPVIVLTAAIGTFDPGDSDEERQRSAAHWRAGHDKLAARSTRGE